MEPRGGNMLSFAEFSYFLIDGDMNSQNRRALISCLCAIVFAVGGSGIHAQTWVTHQKTGDLEFFGEVLLPCANVSAQLEGVKQELVSKLGLVGNGGSVQVVVFASRTSYQNYLQSKIPEAKNRRAIFYQSGDLFQIYTFNHAELMTDLRHEYTHALLHQSMPFVPLWLDEGLAEYLEEVPAIRSSSARLKAMRWKCRTGWKPNLVELERIPSAASMDSDDYRNSWAWVSYLLNDSEASRKYLRTFVQAISAGEAPGNFSDWLTRRDPEVAKRVGSYFRRFQFSLR